MIDSLLDFDENINLLDMVSLENSLNGINELISPITQGDMIRSIYESQITLLEIEREIGICHEDGLVLKALKFIFKPIIWLVKNIIKLIDKFNNWRKQRKENSDIAWAEKNMNKQDWNELAQTMTNAVKDCDWSDMDKMIDDSKKMSDMVMSDIAKIAKAAKDINYKPRHESYIFENYDENKISKIINTINRIKNDKKYTIIDINKKECNIIDVLTFLRQDIQSDKDIIELIDSAQGIIGVLQNKESYSELCKIESAKEFEYIINNDIKYKCINDAIKLIDNDKVKTVYNKFIKNFDSCISISSDKVELEQFSLYNKLYMNEFFVQHSLAKDLKSQYKVLEKEYDDIVNLDNSITRLNKSIGNDDGHIGTVKCLSILQSILQILNNIYVSRLKTITVIKNAYNVYVKNLIELEEDHKIFNQLLNSVK